MNLATDLKSPFWIHLKGILFLLIGIMCGASLILACPSLKTAALYVTGCWACCRFYYYLFHVLERYLGAAPYPGIWGMLGKLSGRRP